MQGRKSVKVATVTTIEPLSTTGIPDTIEIEAAGNVPALAGSKSKQEIRPVPNAKWANKVFFIKTNVVTDSKKVQ